MILKLTRAFNVAVLQFEAIASSTQGIEFEYMQLTSSHEINAFKTQHGITTTPQIFFGDQRIGGYTESRGLHLMSNRKQLSILTLLLLHYFQQLA